MHWNCMMICVMLFFPMRIFVQSGIHSQQKRKWIKILSGQPVMNNVILHFNMIARYLKMQGKEVQWREQLGDEKVDKAVRKGIGDFGCYIIFVNSICAR